MTNEKHPGGRPPLSEEHKTKRKEDLLQILEPYLKSGLSVNKALKEAKVFNSEFYKYMAEDEFFGEKIQRFRQYVSILVNSVLVNHLHFIVRKQNEGISLTDEDIKFLWWFGLHANVCREEWGRRETTTLYNPEAELQKMKDMIDNEVEEKLNGRNVSN